MGQNQNRPPRDTPAQRMGQTAERQDPRGQDRALRAMEWIADILLKNREEDQDPGPPPGTDLYYELLEREGVPIEALRNATLSPDDMPTFREMLKNYGIRQDDEFYGQDVSPANIEMLQKREPWVIKNVNNWANQITDPSPANTGGFQASPDENDIRYFSVTPQQDIDPRYRQLLMQLLGPGQR